MNVVLASSVNDQIRQAIADIAEALLYPVLIAAIITLLFVAYELGRLGVEAWKRSQRPKTPFEETARQAQAQALAGDSGAAQATLKSYSYGDQLQRALVGTLFAQSALDAQRAVVEYDLYVSKRLDRVRLLVRAGPAIGLMGTLIPLAPALAALGKGQPSVLADELQTAFAVTVVGVLVGLIAFTIALIRERYYTRDLTDLEYLRELRGDTPIGPATVAQPAAATPAHKAQTDQPEAASAALADTAVTTAPTAVATAPAPAPAQPQPTSPSQSSQPAEPAKAPAPAAPAAPAPQAVQATGSTPVSAPAPAVPAVPAVPAPVPPAKKKFGLKKKAPKAPQAPPATGFPPPPPPATIPQPDSDADAKDK